MLEGALPDRSEYGILWVKAVQEMQAADSGLVQGGRLLQLALTAGCLLTDADCMSMVFGCSQAAGHALGAF